MSDSSANLVEPERPKPLSDQPCGLELPVAEFGVLMEVMADSYHLGGHLLHRRVDSVVLRVCGWRSEKDEGGNNDKSSDHGNG
jgi:hypothetical protein